MSNILVAPLEALTDSRLSDPERRVLLALFSFRGKNTNTVWPSVGSICARCHFTDKTRVSKLTTGLASKGWLSKKKRGFTGGNNYELTVPIEAEEELAKLDAEAKLVSEAKLDAKTTSKLVSQTSTKLVPEAKCKEQTNRTNHVNKPINKKAPINFDSWPVITDLDLLGEWLQMRKRNKASCSQRAIDTIGKEIHKAVDRGHTVDDCLSEAECRNWKGFKADWMSDPKPASKSTQRDRDLADKNDDVFNNFLGANP